MGSSLQCRTALIHLQSLQCGFLAWPHILALIHRCAQVLNEDAVLEAIRGVLAERNRGEELVVFNAVSGLALAFFK